MEIKIATKERIGLAGLAKEPAKDITYPHYHNIILLDPDLHVKLYDF